MTDEELKLVAQLVDLVEDLALSLEIPAAAHEARQIAKKLREGSRER
jgi:hypothetical protein